MKRNTAFVDLLKNDVNYTSTFGAEHCEKFFKAHPKDILQEMMASQLLAPLSQSTQASYVGMARFAISDPDFISILSLVSAGRELR